MAESRRQLKERLTAAGKWAEYIALRNQLEREGAPKPYAKIEALRRIGAAPAPDQGAADPTPATVQAADDDEGDNLPPAVPIAWDAGVPDQLVLMRHVAQHPRGNGEDNRLFHYRRWINADVSSFFGWMSKLETEQLEFEQTEFAARESEKAQQEGGDQDWRVIAEQLLAAADGRG